jgi:hypothetical protein
LLVIQGSPTKIVRVLSFTITMGTTTVSSAASYQVFLIKRTSPDYGIVGNNTPISNIPGVAFDAQYGPTATVGTWGSGGDNLGTSQGTMSTRNISVLPVPPNGWVVAGVPLCTPGENWTELIPSARFNVLEQEVTLRGMNEMLVCNCAAVTLPAAESASTWFNILWTESTI